MTSRLLMTPGWLILVEGSWLVADAVLLAAGHDAASSTLSGIFCTYLVGWYAASYFGLRTDGGAP